MVDDSTCSRLMQNEDLYLSIIITRKWFKSFCYHYSVCVTWLFNTIRNALCFHIFLNVRPIDIY